MHYNPNIYIYTVWSLPGTAWCGSCQCRRAERGWARWSGVGEWAPTWLHHPTSSAGSPPGCCSARGTPAEAPRSPSPPGCILGRILAGCSDCRCQKGLCLRQDIDRRRFSMQRSLEGNVHIRARLLFPIDFSLAAIPKLDKCLETLF